MDLDILLHAESPYLLVLFGVLYCLVLGHGGWILWGCILSNIHCSKRAGEHDGELGVHVQVLWGFKDIRVNLLTNWHWHITLKSISRKSEFSRKPISGKPILDKYGNLYARSLADGTSVLQWIQNWYPGNYCFPGNCFPGNMAVKF